MSRAFFHSRTAAVIALTAGSLSLTGCGSGSAKANQTVVSSVSSTSAPTSPSATHSSSAAPTSSSTTSATTSSSTSTTASQTPVTRTVTVTARPTTATVTAQPTSAATSQALAPATKTQAIIVPTSHQLPAKTVRTSPVSTGTATTALGAVAPTVIVKAMNTSGDVALLRNTANTTHCEITASYAACGSDPLIVSRAITPRDSIDPVWWAQVGLSGHGVAETKADALESAGTTLDPQRILPGQSVSYLGFTCTERTNGTTCVNTRNGHGFLINAQTIKPF